MVPDGFFGEPSIPFGAAIVRAHGVFCLMWGILPMKTRLIQSKALLTGRYPGVSRNNKRAMENDNLPENN